MGSCGHVATLLLGSGNFQSKIFLAKGAAEAFERTLLLFCATLVDVSQLKLLGTSLRTLWLETERFCNHEQPLPLGGGNSRAESEPRHEMAAGNLGDAQQPVSTSNRTTVPGPF